MKQAIFFFIMVCATGLLIEGTVRVVNALYPLQRPIELTDTYGRLLISGQWLDGETRFYIYRPGVAASTHGHPFRVNSAGFRGPEFPQKSTRSRVVVIGDSLTSGIGIAEEDRYTDVAQRLLGSQADIINLSIEGFDAPQYAMLLDRYGNIVRPHLVIIGFYVNDTRTDFSQYRYDLTLPPSLDYVLSHSLTYRVFKPYYDPLYRLVHGIPTNDELLQRSYDPVSSQWQLFDASLKRIATWTTTHTDHAPAVLLVTDATDVKACGLYQRARTAFERHGFVWIEAERERPEQSIYEPVSRWEAHANARTHHILGTRLATAIRDLLRKKPSEKETLRS